MGQLVKMQPLLFPEPPCSLNTKIDNIKSSRLVDVGPTDLDFLSMGHFEANTGRIPGSKRPIYAIIVNPQSVYIPFSSRMSPWDLLSIT